MSRNPRDVAREIVVELRDAGHVAYFAGGCVRDELLGLHPKDYDVATDARPGQVEALFPRFREVGRSFGVMLIHRGGVRVEVATFRREGPYSDRRRPDRVEFCDAETDALRRDFTINALFIDPLAEGVDRVIDFVKGRDDLRRKTIRAVGDPDTRLAEDDLRSLRAVRFAARLEFEIEPSTAAAIRRHAGDLAGVSRERIGDEIRMMLEGANRDRAVGLMHELGLDGPALGEPLSGGPRPVRRPIARLRPEAGVALALAAWGYERGGCDLARLDAAAYAMRLRRALCLSNEERNALLGILRNATTLTTEWSALTTAQRKRLAASAGFEQAMQLVEAIDPTRAQGLEDELRELEDSAGGLAPEPLVTGDDLIALGFEPGPRFAELLDAAYDAQLEGRIGSKDQGLALVRKRARGRRGRR